MQASDFIAISSVAVAVGALVFSVVESRRNKKITKLSSTPNLDYRFVLNRSAFDDEVSGIYIINTGIGPAIFRRCKLLLDNKDYNVASKSDLSEYIDTLGIGRFEHGVQAIRSGVFLPAGEKQAIITFDKSALKQLNIKRFHQTQIKGWYESVFGDRYDIGTSVNIKD